MNHLILPWIVDRYNYCIRAVFSLSFFFACIFSGSHKEFSCVCCAWSHYKPLHSERWLLFCEFNIDPITQCVCEGDVEEIRKKNKNKLTNIIQYITWVTLISIIDAKSKFFMIIFFSVHSIGAFVSSRMRILKRYLMLPISEQTTIYRCLITHFLLSTLSLSSSLPQASVRFFCRLSCSQSIDIMSPRTQHFSHFTMFKLIKRYGIHVFSCTAVSSTVDWLAGWKNEAKKSRTNRNVSNFKVAWSNIKMQLICIWKEEERAISALQL